MELCQQRRSSPSQAHFILGCILQQMLRSGLESTHRAGANGAGPSSITSPLGKHSKQKAKQRAQFLVTDTQLWNSIWGFTLHLKVRGKHTFRVSESIASLQLTLKCRFKTGMLCSHHMPCSVALAYLRGLECLVSFCFGDGVT